MAAKAPAAKTATRNFQGRDLEADDIKNLISIDASQLDKEWQMQAKTFLRFALLSADAENAVREANNRIEVVRAELANSIRNSPDVYSIPKATESAVSECILLQPEFETATVAYNKAKHNESYLKAYMRALEHKKAALENYVSLHGMSYFAQPRASAEAKENASRVIRGQRSAIASKE